MNSDIEKWLEEMEEHYATEDNTYDTPLQSIVMGVLLVVIVIIIVAALL